MLYVCNENMGDRLNITVSYEWKHSEYISVAGRSPGCAALFGKRG